MTNGADIYQFESCLWLSVYHLHFPSVQSDNFPLAATSRQVGFSLMHLEVLNICT